MLSSSYKNKCSNFHKKLTEPLQLSGGYGEYLIGAFLIRVPRCGVVIMFVSGIWMGAVGEGSCTFGMYT